MGRTLAYLHLSFALVVLAAVVRPAHAQPAEASEAKSVVVIIDAANTDLLVESLVRSAAEAELRKRGFVIDENAQVGGETPKRLLACAGNPECSVATLSSIPARFVIFISLRPDEEGKSNNFKIVARNYDVATGEALARTMRRCSECEEEVDLANFSEGVVADLIRDATPKPVEPTVVEPVPDPVPDPVVAPIVPAPAATDIVTDTGPAQVPRDGGLSLVGGLKYATLVGGVVGLAGGTVLVLVDGPVVRDGVRQREERDTLTGGFASLASGAVLLGVSAWLWSVDHDDANTARSALVPRVAPGTSGGSLVWTGTF